MIFFKAVKRNTFWIRMVTPTVEKMLVINPKNDNFESVMLNL